MCFSGKFLISWCFPEYAWFVNQDFERGTMHFLLSHDFCLLLLLVRFFSSRCSLRLPRFLIFLRNDTARQTNSHSSHHALSSFRKTLDLFLFFRTGFARTDANDSFLIDMIRRCSAKCLNTALLCITGFLIIAYTCFSMMDRIEIYCLPVNIINLFLCCVYQSNAKK